MTYRYEVTIFWSEENSAFIAVVPELPGCIAHGASYEEALMNARDEMEVWMDRAREQGDPIPKPKPHRLTLA